MTDHTWTVTEAKARLSELLRRADEEGPQRIGTRRGYMVLSEAEWLRLQTARPPIGRWLLDNIPRLDPLELSPRAEPVPDNPFGDDDP